MKQYLFATLFACAIGVISACNVTKTPGPLEPAPTPAPSPSAPNPSPAPTPSPTTAPTLSGDQVVARVAAQYPERLAGGISLEQRVANMEFLRDRIIEVGTCAGLLLARNTKMNGVLSIDAINWRHGEDDVNDVVDLALDYDNASRPLQLHWAVTHGPAGWTPIPTPPCS